MFCIKNYSSINRRRCIQICISHILSASSSANRFNIHFNKTRTKNKKKAERTSANITVNTFTVLAFKSKFSHDLGFENKKPNCKWIRNSYYDDGIKLNLLFILNRTNACSGNTCYSHDWRALDRRWRYIFSCLHRAYIVVPRSQNGAQTQIWSKNLFERIKMLSKRRNSRVQNKHKKTERRLNSIK